MTDCITLKKIPYPKTVLYFYNLKTDRGLWIKNVFFFFVFDRNVWVGHVSDSLREIVQHGADSRRKPTEPDAPGQTDLDKQQDCDLDAGGRIRDAFQRLNPSVAFFLLITLGFCFSPFRSRATGVIMFCAAKSSITDNNRSFFCSGEFAI